MKYITLLSLIIPATSFAMDGLYQLPHKDVIEERLNNALLKNFAFHSQIAHTLADRLFKPVYLHQHVKYQIQQYYSTKREWGYQNFQSRAHSKQPTVEVLMNLLLQDYPRVLIALEKNYDGALLR